ncbi:MAG: nucleotidyltransferase domain-containing protein [Candidatus Scalindua sp.]|jgi:predicted nucleotidyltransferase|nr:nucleotidyltransferase domain-containing protein [Candidatus Scalindua sp.]MBT5306145.1 nucleotidyltransferase domain-containing protein [Candidatus Scalindua sp.]MBT6225731.1 nucleotidyltransferase domain-containing protein [Candidatus Scalindua sp.]MBT6564485.1 nucleotidyltransferase domain-containing protein [Candidatus Scalindua sp.]MBT7213073.1 nucleotidyltransferase domain-containing protein [Candidatus Scalindua sp.]
MRLQEHEIEIIKQIVRNFDQDAEIYLFGSRVYDNQKGGDIDLLIMSDKINNADKRKLRLRLYDELGEQKIDIVLAKDKEKPFTRIVLNEGVLL